MFAVSKITQKGQATIPLKIRKKLHLNFGDYISFDEKDNEIILRRSSAQDKNILKLMGHSLNEWSSKEDDEQFDYLDSLVK